MKKMKKSPAVIGERVSKEVFMALAAQDRRSYTSHYKREPLNIKAPKYINVGGVPHKLVNDVLVPLTKKA